MTPVEGDRFSYSKEEYGPLISPDDEVVTLSKGLRGQNLWSPARNYDMVDWRPEISFPDGVLPLGRSFTESAASGPPAPSFKTENGRISTSAQASLGSGTALAEMVPPRASPNSHDHAFPPLKPLGSSSSQRICINAAVPRVPSGTRTLVSSSSGESASSFVGRKDADVMAPSPEQLGRPTQSNRAFQKDLSPYDASKTWDDMTPTVRNSVVLITQECGPYIKMLHFDAGVRYWLVQLTASFGEEEALVGLKAIASSTNLMGVRNMRAFITTRLIDHYEQLIWAQDPAGYAQTRLSQDLYLMVKGLVAGDQGLQWSHFDPKVLETIRELGNIEYTASRLQRLTAKELSTVKNVPAYLYTLLSKRGKTARQAAASKAANELAISLACLPSPSSSSGGFSGLGSSPSYPGSVMPMPGSPFMHGSSARQEGGNWGSPPSLVPRQHGGAPWGRGSGTPAWLLQPTGGFGGNDGGSGAPAVPGMRAGGALDHRSYPAGQGGHSQAHSADPAPAFTWGLAESPFSQNQARAGYLGSWVIPGNTSEGQQAMHGRPSRRTQQQQQQQQQDYLHAPNSPTMLPHVASWLHADGARLSSGSNVQMMLNQVPRAMSTPGNVDFLNHLPGL